MRKKLLSNGLAARYETNIDKICTVYQIEHTNNIVLCSFYEDTKSLDYVDYRLSYNLKEAIKFLQDIADVEKEITDFLESL